MPLTWVVPKPECGLSLHACHEAILDCLAGLRVDREGLCTQLRVGEAERAELEKGIAAHAERLELLSASLGQLARDKERHDQTLQGMEGEHAKLVHSSRALLETLLCQRGRLALDPDGNSCQLQSKGRS